MLTPEFQVSELLRQQKQYTSAHLTISTAKVYVVCLSPHTPFYLLSSFT
jgi:hypothetical protein